MALRHTTFAIVILSVLSCARGAAQQSYQLDFGVMGGTSASRFSGADREVFEDARIKTRIGFAGGIFVSYSLTPAFALEPQLFYAQKGVKGSGTGGTASINLGYLEVPLLLELRLPAQGNRLRFRPHLHLGPALAFKTSCSFKSKLVGGATTSQDCEAEGAKVKSTDFSILAGAGLDIGRARLNVRYDISLSSIDGAANPKDIKNRAFYLLVGWAFRAPR